VAVLAVWLDRHFGDLPDIIRVWSTDWFNNPGRETDKLVRKLEELKSAPHSPYGDYPSLKRGFQFQGLDSFEVGKPDIDRNANGAEKPECTFSATQEPLPRPAVEAATQAPPLPDEDGPLTKAQGIQALVEFRENVIRVGSHAWEAHRSILRDAMIETFVSQQFTDPDEWFTKVPTYLRQGTDPAEKNMYIDRICEIVSRIEAVAHSRRSSFSMESSSLTSPEERTKNVKNPSPTASGAPTISSTPPPNGAAPVSAYAVTSFVGNGVQPEASRFYDIGYRSTLRKMIALIVATEAPIYEDVLVERIARAHGFQRSGNNIYQTVTSAIDREFGRTTDDNRVVIWANGMATNAPPAFRESSSNVRSHADIPIAELASLAVPFVRLRMNDEEVLRRMADHFGLERLREATRDRFEKALKLARQSLP
jgi:hypothetical protein